MAIEEHRWISPLIRRNGIPAPRITLPTGKGQTGRGFLLPGSASSSLDFAGETLEFVPRIVDLELSINTIHAQHGLLWIVRQRIRFEDFFHASNKLGILLRRNHPILDHSRRHAN